MSITIRKFNQFPNARQFWPDATWFDAELTELDQAAAAELFRTGGELYYSLPTRRGGETVQGELTRIVWAPQTGEVPPVSLAAIDFRALELRARARQLTRSLRAARY